MHGSLLLLLGARYFLPSLGQFSVPIYTLRGTLYRYAGAGLLSCSPRKLSLQPYRGTVCQRKQGQPATMSSEEKKGEKWPSQKVLHVYSLPYS